MASRPAQRNITEVYRLLYERCKKPGDIPGELDRLEKTPPLGAAARFVRKVEQLRAHLKEGKDMEDVRAMRGMSDVVAWVESHEMPRQPGPEHAGRMPTIAD